MNSPLLSIDSEQSLDENNYPSDVGVLHYSQRLIGLSAFDSKQGAAVSAAIYSVIYSPFHCRRLSRWVHFIKMLLGLQHRKLLLMLLVLLTLGGSFVYCVSALTSSNETSPSSEDLSLMAGACPSPNSTLAYWAETDIQMLRVYDEIPFNDLPSQPLGKWQQGFPYDLLHVLESEPTLEVILMPHSHNDPGWLMTFEGYYQQLTSRILSNAHKYLSQYTDMSFEWAEISFLELWWQNHKGEEREALKRYSN